MDFGLGNQWNACCRGVSNLLEGGDLEDVPGQGSFDRGIPPDGLGLDQLAIVIVEVSVSTKDQQILAAENWHEVVVGIQE